MAVRHASGSPKAVTRRLGSVARQADRRLLGSQRRLRRLGDGRDYDEWGAPGWGFDSIEPYLRRAERTIRTRRLGAVELGPWARAAHEAAPEAGIPVLDDLNDLSSPEGAAHVPVNADGFARWNTAFAYLWTTRAPATTSR